MRSFTRRLFRRGIVGVLVSGLLFSGILVYQHFLPKGQKRWITREHQIRRVLARAERDNLKIGAACDEEESLANLPQMGEAPATPEVVGAHGCFFATSQLVAAPPKTFNFERSPVLNL
jgi:hypothetical protein